jgi:hypothetical protein
VVLLLSEQIDHHADKQGDRQVTKLAYKEAHDADEKQRLFPFGVGCDNFPGLAFLAGIFGSLLGFEELRLNFRLDYWLQEGWFFFDLGSVVQL